MQCLTKIRARLYQIWSSLINKSRPYRTRSWRLAYLNYKTDCLLFSAKRARRQIEQALQSPLDDIFATFNDVPVAAASIAQVHKAQLHNGDFVAVKLLRPDIAKHMGKDIAFFKAIAKITSRFTLPLRVCGSMRQLLNLNSFVK